MATIKEVNLPKTAKIAGRTVKLTWDTLATMDGWYAEVSPRVVQELEKDNTINMSDVEQELGDYGDYARYGQESTGKTWLCVYKKA